MKYLLFTLLAISGCRFRNTSTSYPELLITPVNSRKIEVTCAYRPVIWQKKDTLMFLEIHCSPTTPTALISPNANIYNNLDGPVVLGNSVITHPENNHMIHKTIEPVFYYGTHAYFLPNEISAIKDSLVPVTLYGSTGYYNRSASHLTVYTGSITQDKLHFCLRDSTLAPYPAAGYNWYNTHINKRYGYTGFEVLVRRKKK